MPVDVLDRTVENILASKSYEDFRGALVSSDCNACADLCQDRHTIVVDRGNPDTKIVLIGEAPGQNEDLQGKAFVGRAGQLLDKIMAAIGLDTNNDTLIVNVVKCRPPGNRPPTPDEAKNCFGYIDWQLKFVNPKIVVLLGATAARYFLPASKGKSLKDQVGRFFDVPAYPGIQFMLLYHPAYLLRDPRKKKDMWEHVKVLHAGLLQENLLVNKNFHVLPLEVPL